MSLKSVQAIIGKALLEPAFRKQLFSNPDQALKGYDLTREESTALQSLDARRFDAAEADLRARMDKAGSGGDLWLGDLDWLGLS